MFWVFSLDANSVVTRAEFRFLEYQCGFWDFPKKDDINIIDMKCVFYGPCLPLEATKNGNRFEEDEAVMKYNKIKCKNK